METKCPEQSMFALSKVKLTKDGGIAVKYSVSEENNGIVSITNYNIESTTDIHEDLRNLFDALRPMMQEVFDQKSENIYVQSVSIAGEDENLGCTLGGIYLTKADQKCKISSPRLKFASFAYGFEDELKRIVGEIETEVYAYLFQGKQAELSNFN